MAQANLFFLECKETLVTGNNSAQPLTGCACQDLDLLHSCKFRYVIDTAGLACLFALDLVLAKSIVFRDETLNRGPVRERMHKILPAR